MRFRSQRLNNSTKAAASLLMALLFTLFVLTPRVRTMDRALPDDGNPVTVLASLFVLSMVIPVFGVRRHHRLTRWPVLMATQVGCAVIAVATLYAFTPSGDGLYALAITIFAFLTLAGAIVMTVWARRDSQADVQLVPRRVSSRGEASGLPSYPSEYRHLGDHE